MKAETKKLIDKLNGCFINNGNARFIHYKCAEKLLNQFKKEVCKKQRGNCAEVYSEYTNRWELNVMEGIENATEPE